MKKIFLILFLIIFIFISFILLDGYFSYNAIINEIPISEKVSNIRSKENYTSINEVPEFYKNAIIAIEDHRFYNHHGIDLVSTVRAFITNIKEKSLEQGGSSITQQVAKNLYFTQEKRFTRKVSELLVAFDLEKNFSKDEILELYMNNIYFGDGYYCVYDAAYGYFNKEPAELSLYEATLLAGIPNAPSVYAPTKNLKLGTQKQLQVLDAMLKYEYISSEEYDEVLEQINELDLE